MYHRNDAPRDVLAIAQGMFPLVVARHREELRVVMTDVELSACDGSTEKFARHLAEYLTDQI